MWVELWTSGRLMGYWKVSSINQLMDYNNTMRDRGVPNRLVWAQCPR